MNCEEYILKMKNVQAKLLRFLTRGDDNEENFENLIRELNGIDVKNDVNNFRLFLHLVDAISNNHFRNIGFNDKIEKILIFYTEEFGKFLTNSEIYNIFRDNKLVLYFLFENKILNFDHYIVNGILKSKKKKYPNYFINEIKPFINEKVFKEIELENQNNQIDMDPEIFEKNRRKGENESKLCQLVRNDDIDEFITYVSLNDISPQTEINNSTFETNSLLIRKIPNLIEYAAFHGSVQIFRYLYMNGEKPKPYVWIYAVHGDNPELIRFLEEKEFQSEDKTIKSYLVEAIHFHHNEIANYFRENYLQDQTDLMNTKAVLFYNFEFFPENLFLRNIFFHLCQYDYFFIVCEILKNQHFEIDFIIKDTGLYEEVTTPFTASISNDNANVTQILLKHNCNVNVNFIVTKCRWSKHEENQNALSLAILNNNEKIVKLLLENDKIDLNAHLFQKIYKFNSSCQISESISIFESITNKNLEIIQLLASDPRIDINVQKKTYNCIQNGQAPPIVNLATFDPNAFKLVSPLYFSAIVNDVNIARIFLSNPNIDPNATSLTISSTMKYKETPLYYAARIGYFEMVKVLVNDPKVDINAKSIVKIRQKEKNESALHCSVRNNNIEIAKLLIFHPRIDINQKVVTKVNDDNFHENKSSPLIIALMKKQYEIIELLLKNEDIDVNTILETKTNTLFEEKSALFLAVENEDKKIVELLLSHPNIDVNYTSISKSKNGSKIEKNTVLNMAIEKENLAIIELLLKMPKIDINLKSFTRKSELKLIEESEELPICCAIMKGNIDIVKVLLSYPSINLSLKSKRSTFSPYSYFIEEKTPIQKAIISKNSNIIALLFQSLITNSSCKIDVNELINMTDDEQLKAIIYDGISKLNLKKV